MDQPSAVGPNRPAQHQHVIPPQTGQVTHRSSFHRLMALFVNPSHFFASLDDLSRPFLVLVATLCLGVASTVDRIEHLLRAEMGQGVSGWSEVSPWLLHSWSRSDRAPSTGRAQCAAVSGISGLVSPSLEVVRSHSIDPLRRGCSSLYSSLVCTAGRPRHAGGDRPLSQLPPRPRRGGKLGTHLCPAVVLVRRGELLRSDEHLRPGAAKSPPLLLLLP